MDFSSSFRPLEKTATDHNRTSADDDRIATLSLRPIKARASRHKRPYLILQKQVGPTIMAHCTVKAKTSTKWCGGLNACSWKRESSWCAPLERIYDSDPRVRERQKEQTWSRGAGFPWRFMKARFTVFFLESGIWKKAENPQVTTVESPKTQTNFFCGRDDR